MDEPLPAIPEEWDRALAIVAHPDDMEYGAASAVARWTSQGKDVRYLLVTRGEAGIDSMSPDEVGPLRQAEQAASCDVVGVSQLEWLDRPDGQVVADLDLRRDLAASIRRHRPEVVVTINHRDSWGGPSWNHADHRAVGVAVLDSVRDAANRWLFPEAGDPWTGVRFVAVNASPQPTHGVDVSDHLTLGIESLRCHRLYLDALGGDEMADPTAFVGEHARAAGRRLGVESAALFELIDM